MKSTMTQGRLTATCHIIYRIEVLQWNILHKMVAGRKDVTAVMIEGILALLRLVPGLLDRS